MKDAITEKTRLLILNSPHNPAGAVSGRRHGGPDRHRERYADILILSDEVYEHIVFDGHRHESMTRYPELARRSFVVSSFGKTYHATGWKLGYCLAPRPLSAEFQKVHQFVTFASNTPVQLAYADFMEKKEAYLALSAFYQERRDLFLSLIKDSRFRPLPCRGTYFQMLSYDEITEEPDVDFRQASHHGVQGCGHPPIGFLRRMETTTRCSGSVLPKKTTP